MIIFCVLSVVLFTSSFFFNGDNDAKNNIKLLQSSSRLSLAASCTGPKRENLRGNIFCKCKNSSPCADASGCNGGNQQVQTVE